jgi:hypothetical protein
MQQVYILQAQQIEMEMHDKKKQDRLKNYIQMLEIKMQHVQYEKLVYYFSDDI